MNSPNQLSDDFIQLARIALTGRPQDIQLLIHRASKKFQSSLPEFSKSLVSLLQESPSRSSPLRKQTETPLPVDLDSRLQLLRVESDSLEHTPILSTNNQVILEQAISERKNINTLLGLGLHPTKSMLFVGPPGVGKTLTAKWIAQQLDRPLLVLDLAAVMSSYLGRTGNNIRYVLDYAKSTECVLLLDEIDAIAKRRDDTSEIGELKRLVTVLLQEIDDWPSSGLLIAATNHPDLLDPAAWRRFEVVMDFDKPEPHQIESLVKRLLDKQVAHVDKWGEVLSLLLSEKSYSEIERQIILIRKKAALTGEPLGEIITSQLTQNITLNREDRFKLAMILAETGIVSQRQAREITGVSRDTIRKHTKAISSVKTPTKNVRAKSITKNRPLKRT